MQLGFVTAILPELPLTEVLQNARQIGYQCIEVMCWPAGKATRRYAGVTHINVRQLDGGKAKQILQQCADHTINISALGYYPNPLSPDKSERETSIKHLYHLMDGAAQLGLSQVNTFIGRNPAKTIEENWDDFLDVWTPLVAHARQLNLQIGIENCPMRFTKDEWPGGNNLAISPVVWQKMFEAFPEVLGLNYDPSHLVLQQMDYLAPIRNFAHKIQHFHAKDLRIDQHRLNEVGIFAHPAEWHTPKLPGFGAINWGQLIAVLNDIGYQGAFCVEVEDRAYEGSLEERLQSLRISYQYLRPWFGR